MDPPARIPVLLAGGGPFRSAGGYIFCHLWKSEAMRAGVEGVKVIIFCHFWKNEAMRAVGERREIPGMGWAGLAGLAGWLAGWHNV